jgi:serine/threonine protein kinase
MTTQQNMLASHRVLHELGRGTTGAVYAAQDRATGAVVALKRLDPSLSASDANLAGRFLAQARTARRLSHPNVVRIHDAGTAAGTVYVAMEMLEGENLRSLLDRGPLPVARAIRIAREIASGLAHAHLEGVLHGGLKPSNIIVLRSGAAKITDFGIAQAAPLGAGARDYASPEQLRGEPLDHRSDLFSLGVLFYEMLTGRRPAEGEPPPPSELNRHVPRALDAIVLGMLAAQPAARTPGVPVVLQELQRLEEALGLEPSAAVDTAQPAPSVPPPAAAPEPRPQPAPRPLHRNPAADREAFDYQRAIAMMERESRSSASPRPGPPIFAALALLLTVLGLALTYFVDLGGVREELSARIEQRVAANRAQEAPVPPPEVSKPPAVPPMAEATKKPVMEPKPEPVPLARIETPVVRAPEPPPPPPPPPSAEPAPAKQIRPAVLPTAKVAQRQPARMAQLVLLVSPRGELYVNGEHRGTTPPATTFELEPGMHRIEVRNGSRKPYLTYMTVEPGDVRRIRHDFDAKPIRPPG